MSLVMISRDEFNWLAIGALIILLLSASSIIYIIKKPNSK